MKKIFKMVFFAANSDLALLLLRSWVAFSLFYKHGIEKLTGFSDMASHFPDPIHIGPKPGLAYALITDGICSILVIAGLATRLSALLIVINLLVVFVFLHGFSFVEGHAELVYVYLGVFMTLAIYGGGKYSMDHRLRNLKKSKESLL
jgi:putative oxidoreductase